MRHLIAGLLLLMLGTDPSQADEGRQLLEFAGLRPYPGSTELAYSSSSEADYELILGTLRKVRGELTPERAQRLEGRLDRVTWRIPDGRDPRDVFSFFLQQVEAGSRDLLYICQGRDCGSSNDWANQVFGVRELYGPDEDQYYLVARVRSGEPSVFVAGYVIRRGNRRLYAHFDVLRATGEAAAGVSPNPSTFIDLLKKHRRVVLPQLRFGEQQQVLDVEPAAIELAAGALKRELSLRVAVVAHASSGQGIVRDLDISQARARQVVELLVRQGVKRERLYPFGAGSLLPPFRADVARERVELVLP